jgi:hypothetical protein
MLLNARRMFDEDGSACAILLAIEDVSRLEHCRATSPSTQRHGAEDKWSQGHHGLN